MTSELDSQLPFAAQVRTAHAQQLQQGFRTLHFEPSLEADFMLEFDQDGDHRQRWLSLLMLAFWAVLALADRWLIHKAGWSAAQSAVWPELLWVRGGVALVLLTFAALLWTTGLGRWRRHGLMFSVLVLEVGAAWASTCHLRMGVPQVLEMLLLADAALFLPIGLTLRQTLPLALACMVGITGIGVVTLDATAEPRWLYFCFLMGITSMLAAFGAYYREYAQREQFLLRAELGWQAAHDFLTGLANRRMFDHQLRRLLRLARRDGQPLALALLDVDWFKPFNDRYGHPAGDHALQQLAELLNKAASRPLDLAARLGGEELALLIYGADAAATRRLCTELLEAARALAIPHADGMGGVLTLSLGCSLARPGDTPEQLYQRADERLYAAKQAGRNRACFDADTNPA